MKKAKIIGAGISGLTIANVLKDKGYEVIVYEKEDTIGGFCRDHYDEESGCWINEFGPHILHFSKKTKQAKDFLTKNMVRLIPYDHQVLMVGNGNIGYFPPNRVFKSIYETLNPEGDFFDEFIKSYSKKMWGDDWNEVKDSIKSRFKLRSDWGNSYFPNEEVFVPVSYNHLFHQLSVGIEIKRGFKNAMNFDKNELENSLLIVTSPIDEFFNYKFGRLGWKGIQFEEIIFTGSEDKNMGELLPTPVVNLNTHPKYLRVVDYSKFPHNPSHGNKKILVYESPSDKETLCYPVPTKKNLRKLEKYKTHADNFKNLHFLGRLGEYKYKNMDGAILNAIKLGESL